MFLQILQNTPVWVFILFFVLVYLGITQSKPRKVARNRLAILPAVFLCLSLYGVVSAFGIVPGAMLAWAVGVGLAAALGTKLASTANIHFLPASQLFSLPGSWVPLWLMMVLYFLKYAVGVCLAMKLPFIHESGFITGISLAYGAISGAFLARSLTILRSAKQPRE